MPRVSPQFLSQDVLNAQQVRARGRARARGQWTEGHLFFCAIEREIGRCLMTEVPDRRRETLEPIIRRWFLPGSRIISDGWRSYDLLNQLDFGMYDYDVVVHQRNFVDQADETIHTQNIENTWQRAKRKLRRYGTSQVLFTSYSLA